MISDKTDRLGSRLLGTWNQVAMRAYVRQVFCFPLDEARSDVGMLHEHIKSALSRASNHLPHFAGKICLISDPVGKVLIRSSADDVVPLKVFDHRDNATFGWTYCELKSQGFPCKAFVGPLFGLSYELKEDEPGIPVTEVHARIIRGGLLVGFFFHHSISDGIGMRDFVSAFAAQTFLVDGRRKGMHLEFDANIDVDIPRSTTAKLVRESSFERLLEACPEYVALTEPTGPTASPRIRHAFLPSLNDVAKTGRIFRFGRGAIEELKRTARLCANTDIGVGYRPSTFACLAALTWSFCTSARVASQPRELEIPVKGSASRLLVPVSWKQKAFHDLPNNYASNAVCIAHMKASVHDHFMISSTTTASIPSQMTPERAILGRLIWLIDESVSAVDDDFVRTRTALFRVAPDPRLVGINLDPQDPLHFMVNSWRHLGGDIEFNLPGVRDESGDGKADSVRRAQPAWNMGAGLILPGKKDSDYEILVTLDTASMGTLLASAGWASWVSETVE